MYLLIVKYAVTAFVIVLVSEIAKHTGRIGALVAALPLVSVMVMIWMHVERQDAARIADFAYYSFWYVIPTLPMFLAMPWLLHRNVNFWAALAVCVVVTAAAFALVAWLGKRIGLDLMP